MPRFRTDKLTANAVSLLVATVVTGLGVLAFWELAARTVAARGVGTAYAEVSALTLIAMIAQLNLTNVFIRFVPAAGRFTTRFVFRGYMAVGLLAVLIGIAYVVSGLADQVVPSDFPNRVLFVAAVPLFAVFALEDSVLTALRITHWVPIENGTTALVKILLLPALVFLPAHAAILVAWTAPVVLAVIIVNAFLFGRAMPAVESSDADTLPPWRRLMSFVVAEYLTSLFAAATLQVMPLIVVWQLGPTEGAYFAIPWLICNSIVIVLWNVGSSFMVEVVAAGAYSSHMMRRSLQLWAVVCGGAMVGVLVLGPIMVGLAGPAYGAHGTMFVRIIALSVPFTFVRVLYQVFTWLEQRVWLLLAISALSATSLLALSIVLLPELGITAVAWAYLSSQAFAAALMAPSVWTRVRTIRMAKGPLRLEGSA